MNFRKRLCVAIATAFVLTNATAHAEDRPPAYQHLKDLEPLAGVWKTTFDPPGPAPQGELEIHFRWMGNKSYLQSSVLFRPHGTSNDEPRNPEFTVIGYDWEESEIRAWIFKYTAQGRAKAIVAPGKLEVTQQEGDEGEPNYRKQTKTYNIESDSQLIVTTTSESTEGIPKNDPPLRLTKSH